MRIPKPRKWYNHAGTLYFRVRYTDANGRSHERKFQDEDDANDFCKDLGAANRKLGKAGVASADEAAALALWREYADVESTEGRDAGSLRDIVKGALDRLRAGVDTPSLRELNRQFIRAKKREGSSDRHLRSLEHRLERIEGYMDPSRRAGEFNTQEIEKALGSLGVMLSAQTVKGIRGALHASYQWGVDRDLVPHNPVTKAKAPKVKLSEVGIITASKFNGLLKTAKTEDPASVAPLAIWGFCGVRRAELCRLTWQEIDLEADEVKIPASKSKTGTSRFIPIPAACKEWIESATKAGALPRGKLLPGEGEKGSEAQLRKWLDAAREGAGITEWPANALRHSFASHACAATEDYPQVAAWLGHWGDTRLLEQRYRKAVRKKEGEKWFEVRPEAPKGKGRTKRKVARRKAS